MINELSAAQRPAQPINAARMRVGVGSASLWAGLEGRYELVLADGMCVSLCHIENVKVQVKSMGGRTLVVN